MGRLAELLSDTAQGASNAVASNVSAPVDAIAWLLRKAGVPVGDAPVGGSDWMAQKGLTRQPTNRIAGLVGETLGMTGPMVAAAKAPQIAGGLLKAMDNAAIPATLNPQTGAIVYHGSPHKFDKFDSSKIGTGEGAQAYGHGLYLAEHPETAMTYMPRDPLMEQSVMRRYSAAERQQQYPAMQVYEDFLLHKTPQEVADNIAQAGYSPQELAQAQAAHKIASEQYFKQRAGALYKVDLPDDQIAKMLDWDKPLSQQPAGAALRVAKNPEPGRGDEKWLVHWNDQVVNAYATQKQANEAAANMRGADLYANAINAGQKPALDAFKNQGIPGIRYLDGMSRGQGVGSSNFVVFPGNEDLLTILERNGRPIK